MAITIDSRKTVQVTTVNIWLDEFTLLHAILESSACWYQNHCNVIYIDMKELHYSINQGEFEQSNLDLIDLILNGVMSCQDGLIELILQ